MPKNGPITVIYADGTTEIKRQKDFDSKKFSYRRYRRSRHWRAMRRTILARDGHRCTDCGATEGLEVHHLSYERLWRETLEDLVTLCQGCHAMRHRWDPTLVSGGKA